MLNEYECHTEIRAALVHRARQNLRLISSKDGSLLEERILGGTTLRSLPRPEQLSVRSRTVYQGSNKNRNMRATLAAAKSRPLHQQRQAALACRAKTQLAR